MLPKVSIIVPVYNVEDYLERCVLSLINQTLKEIEIVLVDDGSPDKCPQICDQYAMKENRIKVIHKNNGGLGLARNSGLEIATGEYVGFVDSDDYVALDMYETLYRKAESGNYDCVYSGDIKHFNEGKDYFYSCVDKDTVFADDSLIDFRMDMICSHYSVAKERKYGMSVWRGIYKNEVLINNRIRFVSEREYVSEDIVFQISLLLCARKALYIHDCFYYYCQDNSTSLTKNFLPEKYQRFKNLRNKLKQICNNSEADERIDRFFFFCIKGYLFSLVESSVCNKFAYMNKIVYDEIWNGALRVNLLKIKKPIWHRLMISLVLSRHTLLLYKYIQSVAFLKSFLK